jgi:hypothetical protein
MSRNINGVPVIYDEPDDICELCGKVAETRPYGPGGKRICWECGLKDPKTRDEEMAKRLFGESIQ